MEEGIAGGVPFLFGFRVSLERLHAGPCTGIALSEQCSASRPRWRWFGLAIDLIAVRDAQKSSWHNELHASRSGFDRFADLFHATLRALFPTRVV